MDRKIKLWAAINKRAKSSPMLKRFIKETEGIRFANLSVDELKNMAKTVIRREKITRDLKEQFDEERKDLKKIKELFTGKDDLIQIKYNRSIAKGLRKYVKNDYGDKILILRRGNRFVTIKNAEQLKGYLRNPWEMIVEETRGSDTDFLMSLKFNDDFTLHMIPKERFKNAGAYFPFYHKLPHLEDILAKYQILLNGFPKTHCLYHALIQSGKISQKQLIECKTFSSSRYVSRDNLKSLAIELNIHIKLASYANGRDYYTHYNKKPDLPILELGLLEGHYFLNDKPGVSSAYIEKYFDLTKKEHDIGPNIILNRNKYIKNTRSSISAYQLVSLLLKHKETHLDPIDMNNCDSKDTYVKPTDFMLQEFNDRNAKSMDEDENETDNEDELPSSKLGVAELIGEAIYFDFESTTDGLTHKPYLVCDSRGRSFRGSNCAKDFLQSFNTDYNILIAHNLRYDLSFLKDHLLIIKSMIKSGTKIKVLTGQYYNNTLKKLITFRCVDSMSFLSTKLSMFSEMFKLDTYKEIMPYEAYTEYSIKLNKLRYNVIEPMLSTEDFNAMKQICIEQGYDIDGKYFKHIDYAQYYCHKDVELLKQGFETFRRQIIDISIEVNPKFPIDIIHRISLPQVANELLSNAGCFDNCYKLSGPYREFISKAVVGGRCMSSKNQKQFISSETDESVRIGDLDANSLYPSAMAQIPGFIQGKPKLLTNLSYEFLQKQDHYFVEIDITKINKELCFPLINYVNNEEVRMFENRLGRIIVDKTGLEDLIEFQEIEFDIIQGCYFNEGFNTKIVSFIQDLFEKRKAYKQQHNPIEQTYKLLMNSSYGKLIQKPFDTKTRFYSASKLNKKLNWHFRDLKEVTKINDNIYQFDIHASTFNHFNCVHIGSQILSMSKRIMNQVITLADDKIYYQDTDSLHIQHDAMNHLVEDYKNKYGKDLIGNSLGQFSDDFDALPEHKNLIDKSIPIVSTKLIVCGKKTYLDRLEYYLKDGTKIVSHHVRCKGVPNTCIYDTCKTNGIDIETLYERMYNGKKTRFNLSSVCKFESLKSLDMTNRSRAFIRELQF